MFSTFYHETLRPLFQSHPSGDARIAVIGVGGGGGNAVNNMVEKGIGGVDFIAINTDSQDLSGNLAGRRIQAGKEATRGLGAGAEPEIGATAVEESRDEIKRAVAPYDMVFVTAGMGGGTGTGGAPVVASLARELGVLTVGIVTRPFPCEGPHRMEVADRGIEDLRTHTDTLLVIPNERLLDLASDTTSLEEAFWMADEVLYDATRGIVDLITYEGLINLDFADVKRTMKDGGNALLGMSTQFSMRQHRTPRVRNEGYGSNSSSGSSPTGPTRPAKAAMEAISSPLFDGQSIVGAEKVLVNVTGGPSLGFREAMSATELIQEEAGEECEVIFGAVTEDAIEGHFQVTVIATGIDDPQTSSTPIEIPTGTLDEAPPRNGSAQETPTSDPIVMSNGSD